MKKIENLTHEEIVQLTQEQLMMLIQYECAERGIKILPEPEEPPTPVSAEPDMVVFEIGYPFAVKNKEVFDEIRNVFEKHKHELFETGYTHSVGSDYKYLKPADQYQLDRYTKLTEVKVFSRDKYDSVKTKLAEYNSKKAEYDKYAKEYNEHEKSKHAETSYIMKTYYAHCRLANRLKQCIEEMEKYIDLADGDMNIAYKFFTKAYSENDWITFKLNQYFTWQLFDISEDEIDSYESGEFEKGVLDTSIQVEIES